MIGSAFGIMVFVSSRTVIVTDDRDSRSPDQGSTAPETVDTGRRFRSGVGSGRKPVKELLGSRKARFISFRAASGEGFTRSHGEYCPALTAERVGVAPGAPLECLEMCSP